MKFRGQHATHDMATNHCFIILLQPTPEGQNADGTGIVQLDADWQSSTRSLRERSAVMLKNELLADVHFIVGSDPSTQRRIPAHKYILVTGSSVFYAMFCGSLAEEKKEITIPDVEPQAFINLLKWVHGRTNEIVKSQIWRDVPFLKICYNTVV